MKVNRQFLVLSLGMVLICSAVVPTQTAHAKVAPGTAALLNIIPGVGHMSTGRVGEGFLWFTSIVGSAAFLSGNERFGNIPFDIWLYSMGNIYRRQKPANGMFSDQSVFSDYLANYNPLNLIDWINPPLLGAGAVVYSRNNPSKISPAKVLRYSFVGFGEEGFFRGFLYPGMTDVFGGSKTWGAITSSVLFALAHLGEGKVAISPGVFGFRTLAGLLFCIQTTYNDYDMRKSIFGHSWWDVLVADDFQVGQHVRTLGLKWTVEF